MNNLIKLNLGCAKDIKDGYINIDTCPFNESVVKMDIRDLQFDNSSVDEIYAKDIIEHMPFEDSAKCIGKWCEILKSGGFIFIQTICFDSFIEAYSLKIWDIQAINYMLFAGINWVDGISRNEDFHKSIYSKEILEKILIKNNCSIIKIEFDLIDKNLINNPYCHNLNLKIHARKN
jgi:hypothetical protein